MLYYVCARSNAQTLGPLLLYFQPDLLRFVRIVPSDSVEVLEEIDTGLVIWTDFDLFTPYETAGTLDVCRRLSTRPTVSQLNNPEASLQRFDLLRALHAKGVNTFNVFRVTEAAAVKRHPVFIRRESGTTKRPPQLLFNLDQLTSAIARIVSTPAEGADLVVIELGNAPDRDGYFKKYGVYRVGERIYPQHVVLAQNWFAKFPRYRGNTAQKHAQNDYFNGSPDVDALMQLFALAHIEYGRMDYCIVDGRIEVFEINTNPAVINNPPTRFDRFDYGLWADRHADALLCLDGPRWKKISRPRARPRYSEEA